VGKNSRNIWVIQRLKEEYLKKNFKLSFKSDRVSIEALSTIYSNIVELLVFLTNGSHMNVKIYINKIMEQYLQLFWKKIWREKKKQQIYNMNNNVK